MEPQAAFPSLGESEWRALRRLVEHKTAAFIRPASEHLTDLGNARRLVARHGTDLRFVQSLQAWFAWDGRRFRLDDSGEVARRAKETVRAMLAEAANMGDDQERAALAAHAIRSESQGRIAAMIVLAQSEPEVAVRADTLDADPWLLNVANGTLNLRTGALRPHDRRDLITRLSPVAYDPDARLDLWGDFIAAVTDGDGEQAAFLQRAAGYSLTGDTGEEVFFLGIGPGGTGKGTLGGSVHSALGEYAATAEFETFLSRRAGGGGARNDIARLRGVRFVVAVEAERGARFDAALVKTITGGDTVAARFLYREAFEFRPTFKVWLFANHAPRVRSDDGGLWRRVLRVPFRHAIPKNRQDPTVKARLRDPMVGGPAVLAWAVAGCLAWQRQRLGVPPSVERETAAYREEMDPLREFLTDRCALDPDAWTSSGALWGAYVAWAQDAGERNPLTRREFADRLQARGVAEKRAGHAGTRGWRVRLLHDLSVADGAEDRP